MSTSPKSSTVPSFDDAEMFVTKRNGKLEVVSFDKILQRIKKVGVEVGIKINYTALAMKVIDQLYNNISTRQIDELTAEQCASMSSTHPDYNILAGRITISNHHKNTDSSFSKVMTQLYKFVDGNGVPSPLVSKEFFSHMNTLGIKTLNSLCDFSRDYLIDYFGFKTLERAYLIRINKKIVERPQHMWLRVAIGIHGCNMDKVVQTYHYMSNKFFTHATPTLFNAGTPNPQLSSCYLMAMEKDSIDGIFNTLKDCALISKWAGGIGLHIHNIRATGSHIRGTNGTSNGIVPMLKVFNNTAKYVDQCVSPQTWIYTTEGPQQIKNVVSNLTEIFNENGGTEVVQNVLEHEYHGPIHSIRTGHSIESLQVTPEHPLYAVPASIYANSLQNMNTAQLADFIMPKLQSRELSISYIDAKEIVPHDFLVYTIPTYTQDIPSITTEDCLMYGILHHHINVFGKNEFSISTPNIVISKCRKELVPLMSQYLNSKMVKNLHIHEKGETETHQIYWESMQCLPFRYSDFFNAQENTYFSPKWLNLPLNKIKWILRGMLYSTWLHKYSQQELLYQTTSRVLIESIQYLLLRMGALASVMGTGMNDTNMESKDSTTYCISIPRTKEVCYALQIQYYENPFITGSFILYENKLLSRVYSNTVENPHYQGTLYDLQMKTVHSYMIQNGVIHNGGGKRNGSFAIYLEPWHADIEMFLQMRKNHGDEELKARDLFYALWTPDLFMVRVKENKSWTLMCPSECPGLSDVYGDDFVQLYTKYESQGKGRKTVSARELWFQILDAQMETGTPYLLYKDAANIKSNQKNLGTIKSSNLCVAPETLVLTDAGQYPIYSLWAGNYPECEQERRQYCQVWNGSCFSQVEVKKTKKNNSEFIKVWTNDGETLTCTPHHKFYVIDESDILRKTVQEVEAKDLKGGMLLEPCYHYPVIDAKIGNDGETLPEKDKGKANYLGCVSGMKNIALKNGKPTNAPIFVPVNYSLKEKLEWFSGFVEPYMLEVDYKSSESDQLIYVPSRSLEFLQDVKHMLQTCGINVVIRMVQNPASPNDASDVLCEMVIHTSQIKQLMMYGMQLTVEHFSKGSMNLEELSYTPEVRIIDTEVVLGRVDDTYCFTEPFEHAGVFNGIRTGQCTEIVEYSDEHETAVCNLASIALPAFLREPETEQEIKDAVKTNGLVFDYSLLHEVSKVVTENLNRIIDVNYYPTEKTRKSNMRHRPIGIGIQGLADVFLRLGWTFSSTEAKQLNKYAFETIYHAALEQSCELAKAEGQYETFEGSPASKGILQFDMWNVTPDSEMYNWELMKKNVQKYGLRNSLLLAPMPTASTSQILGYNECMEPITSNIYSRRTLAGEFILVNKYLMQEMISLNLWNETLKNHMVANNGSIQNIEYIPLHIREKYRTVWEIPMRELIDMSADRGAYICQSQSLNLWLEDPDYKTMTSMHFYSWSKGLKTGIYYLRRRPRHQPQQFTIEPEKAGGRTTIQPQEEICEMCSA
jgi:ribonucleoside-diphosphate reductase alpha chain